MRLERDAAVVCQAASVLLQYPDESVHDRVPLVRLAATSLPPGRPRTALSAFLEHVASTPSGELAEHYVATSTGADDAVST